MTTRISDEQRRWRLAHRHRLLAGGRTDDTAAIADDLVALHSSDPATVYLSCLVRMVNPSIERVEAALYDERSVVRHHAMRRTIWVMTPEVARLAHATATAKIAAAERKRTVKALATTDIDDPEAWFTAGQREVIGLLAAEGQLGTREIGRRLPHLVVPVKFGAGANIATLNAHTKMLQGSGFDADLVRTRPSGTWMSSEYAWSATETWLGHPIAGLETRPAAAELVDRYLRRFGPCTETDLRWWFGETATLVRNALADSGAVEVEVDGGVAGWVAADDVDEVPDPGPWVRLLPGLDPTAMGWKERDWYVDPTHAPRLFDRFGNIGPTIWADGRVVGGWVQRPDGSIVLDRLESLSAKHEALLNDAVEELEQVLGDAAVRPRFPSRNQKELLAD